MITLEIAVDYQSQVDAQPIHTAAQLVLKNQSPSVDSEITIVITDDESLRALNFEFREINSPTDVLSFPADFTDPETEAPYLGDILISYPRAKSQADKAGNSVIDELQVLVVHGVLHLLGYDHTNPQEKEVMWEIQKEIFRQLGLENIQIVD